MKTNLNILMLEDDPFDAELNIEQLRLLEEYNCIVDLVDNKEAYINKIENQPPDIILCDFKLPRYNGQEALNDLRERNLLIPFIFVTGAMNEETAADAIKSGAWDYVVKDRLFRLPLAVRSVLKLKEEKEVAARAEEKAQRLLTAIEQSSAQIIVSSKEGIIEYVNKKFTEVTGYQPNEVIGKKTISLSPDDPVLGKESKIVEQLKKGTSFKGEVLSKKKDGSSFWELISITPIKNSENKITNFVAVKEDITVRKKMEQELIEAKDEAEKSNKLKDAFLQNMSHEIRTPLNAIVGFSNLLNESENTTQNTLKEYTSIIHNSSQQLLSIVTDVVTIAKIQTGQEKINYEPVDINDLIDQLYLLYLPTIQEKDLEFHFSKQITGDKLLILTDKTKLSQILTNLLNNAIKFTHHGSIEFKQEISEDKMWFYVKDTGIGIEKKLHELIFERFRQADIATHTQYGGTGLGLSISKSFAEMLGGSICVESELGQGAIFCLSIPYKPAQDDSYKKEEEVVQLVTSALKILVVEDEINNYLLIKSILLDDKITIYHTANGLEALEFCRDNSDIDLVLMDIKMPVMDGVTAFNEIRKIRPNLPIIAQTAYALVDDKQKFLNIGFNNYISKPINKSELLEKINKTILNK